MCYLLNNKFTLEKYLCVEEDEKVYAYYCPSVISSGSSNVALLSTKYYRFSKYQAFEKSFDSLAQIVCVMIPIRIKNVIRISLYREDFKYILEESSCHKMLAEEARSLGITSIILVKNVLIMTDNRVVSIMPYYTPVRKVINNMQNIYIGQYDTRISKLFDMYFAKIHEYFQFCLSVSQQDLEKTLRNDEALSKYKRYILDENERINLENEIKLMINSIFLDDECSYGYLQCKLDEYKNRFLVELRKRLNSSFISIFRKLIVQLLSLVSDELKQLKKNFGFIHGDLSLNNILCEYDEEKFEITKVYFIDFGFSKYTLQNPVPTGTVRTGTVAHQYVSSEFIERVGEDDRYIPNNDLSFLILYTLTYFPFNNSLFNSYSELVKSLFLIPAKYQKTINMFNDDLIEIGLKRKSVAQEVLYAATKEIFDKLIVDSKDIKLKQNIKVFMRKDLPEAISELGTH